MPDLLSHVGEDFSAASDCEAQPSYPKRHRLPLLRVYSEGFLRVAVHELEPWKNRLTWWCSLTQIM